MSVILKTALFSLFLVLYGCSDSDSDEMSDVAETGAETSEDNTGSQEDSEPVSEDSEPDVELESEARYRVTFSDQWTAENFPTRFPSSRHFSGLIGATHNEQVIFWESGQPATPGIREMAETGGKSTLQGEIEQSISEGVADAVLSGGGLGNSPDSVSLEFTVNGQFPQITLVSMVAPSPDWFIGVHNLDLIGTDGRFVDNLTVSLIVYDAGTDSGTSFTSADAVSSGQVISRLSCQVTYCDFENGIHRDNQTAEIYIGEFFFQRTDR